MGPELCDGREHWDEVLSHSSQAQWRSWRKEGAIESLGYLAQPFGFGGLEGRLISSFESR